jgi:predicted RNA-binding Zn-ribbon protein involved in translation (DUF1610 family)
MKVYQNPERPDQFSFECPGCGQTHVILMPTWEFNGNVNSPTFRPSLLVRGGHYMPEHSSKECWCTYNQKQIEKGEEPSSFKCLRCHSYITDGKIQFLNDCSHQLAGQTVELPEINN